MASTMTATRVPKGRQEVMVRIMTQSRRKASGCPEARFKIRVIRRMLNRGPKKGDLGEILPIIACTAAANSTCRSRQLNLGIGNAQGRGTRHREIARTLSFSRNLSHQHRLRINTVLVLAVVLRLTGMDAKALAFF